MMVISEGRRSDWQYSHYLYHGCIRGSRKEPRQLTGISVPLAVSELDSMYIVQLHVTRVVSNLES